MLDTADSLATDFNHQMIRWVAVWFYLWCGIFRGATLGGLKVRTKNWKNLHPVMRFRKALYGGKKILPLSHISLGA